MGKDKDLANYKEFYKLPMPPSYDLNNFEKSHRKFDALVRLYWGELDAITRDLITSFILEYKFLLDNFDKKIEEYEEQIHAKDKEIEDLQLRHNMDLEELVNKYNNEISELKERYRSNISILQEDISEIKEDHRVELEELSKTIEDLQIQIESHKDNISNLNEIVSEKDNLINKLESENEDLKKQLDSKLETTKTIISESVENVENLLSQLNLLDSEIQRQNSEIKMLKAEKFQRDKLIERLSNKIERDNQINVAKIKAREKSIAKYRDGVLQLRKTLEEKNSEISQLQAKVDQLQKENEKILKKTLEIQESYDKTVNLLNQQIRINREYHKLTEKVIMLKNKLSNKTHMPTVPSTRLTRPNKPIMKDVPDLLKQIEEEKSSEKIEKNPDYDQIINEIDKSNEEYKKIFDDIRGIRSEPEKDKALLEKEEKIESKDYIKTIDTALHEGGKIIRDIKKEISDDKKEISDDKTEADKSDLESIADISDKISLTDEKLESSDKILGDIDELSVDVNTELSDEELDSFLSIADVETESTDKTSVDKINKFDEYLEKEVELESIKKSILSPDNDIEDDFLEKKKALTTSSDSSIDKINDRADSALEYASWVKENLPKPPDKKIDSKKDEKKRKTTLA